MAEDEPFVGYDEHGNPVERSDPPRVGPFIGYDDRGNATKLPNLPPPPRRFRVRTILLALLGVGALIGGWIALRDNGFLGGLDHDGPLTVAGVNDGVELECRPRQLGADHMVNHGDSNVVIDEIALTLSAPDKRDLRVTQPITFDSKRQAFYMGSIGTDGLIDPRPPHGLVIKPHEGRGVSYGVAVRPIGIPKYADTFLSHGVDGLIVDYHVGARHFRATGGIKVTSTCSAPKNAP